MGFTQLDKNVYIYMRLKKREIDFFKIVFFIISFFILQEKYWGPEYLKSEISTLKVNFKGHSKFFSFPREVIYIFSSYLWTWISMNLIYLFRSLNFFMSRGLIPFFSMSTSRAFDHYLLLIFYFFYCNWKKIYIYRNLTKHY